MLSIQLLGTPNIANDGQPVSVSRRKSRALLFYLAAHQAPVTRERVLALLWPDHDRPAAQQILRTSLHGLRKELGAALLASDDTLALSRDAEVDARIFEARLASPGADPEMLASALQLYRGDFLACDGFDVRDRLHAIGCPVEIVCGDADRMTPPKHAEQLRDRIAGARLTLAPGAGHMLPIEQPAAVTVVLRALVASISS